ncbi:MAG: UDP-N-acetylmuramoyl-L-alanine--D-glutamate ligase [Oscillospiraceae bacterium]|nr:UDP-N-acetylmuramoyl-L-alanine--D-glutamate ligase [Oscillospiraceae bacterium]
MIGDYRNIKTLKEFKDFIKNKSVAVVGIAVSNIALIDFLCKCGVEKITARDKKDIFADGKIPELEDLGKKIKINYILGDNYLEDLNEDIIFKTPAIRRDLPQIINALNNNSIITSEIELFFMLCPAKTIAITGSEGKTTTTTIIGEILKKAGKKVYVGGNIGTPLLNQIENIKEEDYAVLEVSSFQLFDLDNNNFKPDYAIITNITPNHLDWHKDMQEYINAKKIIFKNQKEPDKLILDFDNDLTRIVGRDDPDAPRKFFFSENKLPDEYKNGIYCDGEFILMRENGAENKIMDKSGILIKGEHNVLNFMAAIGVTHDIVNTEAIINVAKIFKGVANRIEFVREFDGVSYYNSSADSTPTRTISALNNFNYLGEDKKIIVILGGYDKKIPFDSLAPVVHKKAKAAVLYGETKNIIKKCLDDYKNNYVGDGVLDVPHIQIADNFESAVETAKKLANPGDIVLLSPACASFDCFKNFEERGNRFIELVKGF